MRHIRGPLVRFGHLSPSASTCQRLIEAVHFVQGKWQEKHRARVAPAPRALETSDHAW